MYPVIDYYQQVDKATANSYQRGCFWWACFPYRFKGPTLIRFWPNRPTEKIDLRTFDPQKERRDEITETEAGEFLGVSKFKPRPVIILSHAGTQYKDRAWYGGDFMLVAAIRSLRDEITGEYRGSPNFVWGAITYQYSSIFYLPSSADFDVHEAVIDFDWMTTIHRSWLLRPRNVRLTGEAITCLDEWLRYYLFGTVRRKFNDDLIAYRQMVGEDPQIRTGVFGKTTT